MNAKEVTERLHKHGYYDHKDTGDGNGLPVYKWYTYDSILVASDTSKAKAAHEAYKHYLAPVQQITPQAPAPVDIATEAGEFVPERIVSGDFAILEIIPDVLAEKNERIAALEAALSQLRDTMLKGVSSYELSDMIKLINATLETPRKLQIEPIDAMGDGGFVWHEQAPQAAPVPQSADNGKGEILWRSESGYFVTLEENGYLLQNPIADPESYHATLGEAINAAPVQADAVTKAKYKVNDLVTLADSDWPRRIEKVFVSQEQGKIEYMVEGVGGRWYQEAELIEFRIFDDKMKPA